MLGAIKRKAGESRPFRLLKGKHHGILDRG